MSATSPQNSPDVIVRRARQEPADDRHGRTREPQQSGNWSHEVAIFVHATVIDLSADRLRVTIRRSCLSCRWAPTPRWRSRHGDVVISHALDPALDVNLTAFLVGADGRVRSDADMIFFNQPEAEGGCARYHAPRIAGTTVEHRLSFDLARLPDGIEKIVVALTEDQGPGFAAIRDLIAHTGDVQLSPVPTFSAEKGLMVAEVYVRGGQDKVRAVWQGFSSGLHGLATAHGVEVDSAAPKPEPPVISLGEGQRYPQPEEGRQAGPDREDAADHRFDQLDERHRLRRLRPRDDA